MTRLESWEAEVQKGQGGQGGVGGEKLLATGSHSPLPCFNPKSKI